MQYKKNKNINLNYPTVLLSIVSFSVSVLSINPTGDITCDTSKWTDSYCTWDFNNGCHIKSDDEMNGCFAWIGDNYPDSLLWENYTIEMIVTPSPGLTNGKGGIAYHIQNAGTGGNSGTYYAAIIQTTVTPVKALLSQFKNNKYSPIGDWQIPGLTHVDGHSYHLKVEVDSTPTVNFWVNDIFIANWTDTNEPLLRYGSVGTRYYMFPETITQFCVNGCSTINLSSSPTENPSIITINPTLYPTLTPITNNPTNYPTITPSSASTNPTNVPTSTTNSPTKTPTTNPTLEGGESDVDEDVSSTLSNVKESLENGNVQNKSAMLIAVIIGCIGSIYVCLIVFLIIYHKRNKNNNVSSKETVITTMTATVEANVIDFTRVGSLSSELTATDMVERYASKKSIKRNVSVQILPPKVVPTVTVDYGQTTQRINDEGNDSEVDNMENMNDNDQCILNVVNKQFQTADAIYNDNIDIVNDINKTKDIEDNNKNNNENEVNETQTSGAIYDDNFIANNTDILSKTKDIEDNNNHNEETQEGENTNMLNESEFEVIDDNTIY
eukprot:145936_1